VAFDGLAAMIVKSSLEEGYFCHISRPLPPFCLFPYNYQTPRHEVNLCGLNPRANYTDRGTVVCVYGYRAEIIVFPVRYELDLYMLCRRK
jgi:hypothetical protein